MTVQDLPALNGCLNATASVFLMLGYIAIKKKNKILHRNLMLCALGASALFLTSYLYYHFNIQLITKYTGIGISKWIYYFILATHVPLATLMVPFILFIVWQAYQGNFEKHRRVARWVFPVWMYVSVTGVIIYLMLYRPI